MKYWFFAAVVFYAASSSAYSFTPNTQCVLCNTVIRCGPGVDSVIRPLESGREVSVEKYCAQISNEKDPRYRELRNIFNKNRFSYKEYLEKLPVLNERRIDITPKPLIGANELINTSRTSDLQNYTNYILNSVDPKQDQDLEVDSDGKLVNRLDRQSQKVKDDLKSRMPSSENAAVKRNGAWVSPEQDPYINPLEKNTSGTKKRTMIPPSPTPTEWRSVMDDSFRRSYCRGKTDRECNELWNLQNRKEQEPQEEKPKAERVKTTKPVMPSTTLPNISQQSYPSASNFGSEGIRMPTSVGSGSIGSTTIGDAAKSAPSTFAAKPQIDAKMNTGAVTSKIPGSGVLKMENLPAASLPKQDILTGITMINTSPAYKSLNIPTPYGTMVHVKVQPSGNIFSGGRPICESLEQWRTTSFFVDALRNIDPNNPDIKDTSMQHGFLSATNYCQGNSNFDKTKCEFGKPQAACSCNDYSTQHLLQECNKKFTLPAETAPVLNIIECKKRLQTLITSDQDIATKFARPYALSLGETYLCLDIPESGRQACNEQVNKMFVNMSEKECSSLHAALGSDAAKFISKNSKDLEKYSWFKLYKYHSKEFQDMFPGTKLDIKSRPLVKGRPCNQQIRGVLEDVVAQLEKDNLKDVERLNGSYLLGQRQLKQKFTTLCSSVQCHNIFSEDIARNFASKDADKSISPQMASEMKKLTAFYRDLTVYENLNGSFCPLQSPANGPAEQQPMDNLLGPKPEYLQSPLPGAN